MFYRVLAESSSTQSVLSILITFSHPSISAGASACNFYCAASTVLPAAGVRVLLLAAQGEYSYYIFDVQSKLQATGAFAAVDTFDALSSTPSLSTLKGYNAVLAWFCCGSVLDSDVGDVLAQYWDGGGAVVAADTLIFQGRFGTVANGYLLIDATAGDKGPSDSLGAVLEPQSPLMAGVASLSASEAWSSTGAVINGGVVVAKWASNGRPLVVRGTLAGRPLVTLNMLPPSSDARSTYWTGDGVALMRNALLYSVCAPCVAGTFAAAAGARNVSVTKGRRG